MVELDIKTIITFFGFMLTFGMIFGGVFYAKGKMEQKIKDMEKAHEKAIANLKEQYDRKFKEHGTRIGTVEKEKVNVPDNEAAHSRIEKGMEDIVITNKDTSQNVAKMTVEMAKIATALSSLVDEHKRDKK